MPLVKAIFSGCGAFKSEETFYVTEMGIHLHLTYDQALFFSERKSSEGRVIFFAALSPTFAKKKLEKVKEKQRLIAGTFTLCNYYTCISLFMFPLH